MSKNGETAALADQSTIGETDGSREGRWVGANLARKDADRFVTGRVDYAADLIRPGTLHVSLLRSPHAHAVIRDMDVEQAKRATGVVAVLTGADVRSLSKPMPTRVPRERFPGPIEVWCLAGDEVIYVGQPVIAVVAERLADAEAARKSTTSRLMPFSMR
jgi:carbon-monoxide dehydrogenase large subunit